MEVIVEPIAKVADVKLQDADDDTVHCFNWDWRSGSRDSNLLRQNQTDDPCRIENPKIRQPKETIIKNSPDASAINFVFCGAVQRRRSFTRPHGNKLMISQELLVH